MKKILFAAVAMLSLSGCIFDEEAWDFADSKIERPHTTDK